MVHDDSAASASASPGGGGVGGGSGRGRGRKAAAAAGARESRQLSERIEVLTQMLLAADALHKQR